jgi:SAM-dependent methyltransferase
VAGIPILSASDREPTNWNTPASIELAYQIQSGTADAPYQDWNGEGIHPHVQRIIAAAGGNLYKYAVNRLERYPVPNLRLAAGEGRNFLDLGCNWGRWSIAAARKGYRVIGIDPHLDAVIAARQIAQQLKLPAEFVVADARCLPLRTSSFDTVFSYSVIQHFSKRNGSARDAIREIGRVLKTGGGSFIQMPNRNGIRSLYNHLRDRNDSSPFRVRYWTPGELKSTFETYVGKTELSVDGYFGLGIQKSDTDLMPLHFKAVVYASEIVRGVSRVIKPLKYCADSLYVKSWKSAVEAAP